MLHWLGISGHEALRLPYKLVHRFPYCLAHRWRGWLPREMLTWYSSARMSSGRWYSWLTISSKLTGFVQARAVMALGSLCAGWCSFWRVCTCWWSAWSATRSGTRWHRHPRRIRYTHCGYGYGLLYCSPSHRNHFLLKCHPHHWRLACQSKSTGIFMRLAIWSFTSNICPGSQV